ncbi:hypothetical protein HPP92_001862 [Vanilla planifolia]|uniref:Uncharacterized protein n=1 Tax=Vanilla planifolia TaxID=51239 RepID=A0A835VHX9_VANPL|nr:hypothetical protein HPP92_001862 [Vanilla planifolia]
MGRSAVPAERIAGSSGIRQFCEQEINEKGDGSVLAERGRCNSIYDARIPETADISHGGKGGKKVVAVSPATVEPLIGPGEEEGKGRRPKPTRPKPHEWEGPLNQIKNNDELTLVAHKLVEPRGIRENWLGPGMGGGERSQHGSRWLETGQTRGA